MLTFINANLVVNCVLKELKKHIDLKSSIYGVKYLNTGSKFLLIVLYNIKMLVNYS